ncbi:DNA-formamidopyrimidine glycosylase family protein [Cognatilysobacter lacus]|uniref:Endonuclease n=1 Tax=Cognatilysobacter lacus TaxID=1643323 RepID=A0A5D8Z8L3_9GAMM|nr:DNA-formamidopyrimidine glycosylase family protein [Lysobacter lacus]TZF90423.1 endonuclease [Lysobacter lacus]
MPEGPSLVILREEAESLAGLRVREVSGNSTQDLQRLAGKRLHTIRTWGKHLLLDFGDVAVRIHLLMFGSYTIDEARDDKVPRLTLRFTRKREINFYSCSVRFIDEPLDDVYDWGADVMSDEWNPRAARKKLNAMPDTIVADALLEQDVFAGVGNIIKNEVLHRVRIHPQTRVGDLPSRKLGDMIREARAYSFDFYHWKKACVLRKHWQVHAKKACPRDGTPLSFCRHLGKKERRAFWCDTCQRFYGEGGPPELPPPAPPRRRVSRR